MRYSPDYIDVLADLSFALRVEEKYTEALTTSLFAMELHSALELDTKTMLYARILCGFSLIYRAIGAWRKSLSYMDEVIGILRGMEESQAEFAHALSQSAGIQMLLGKTTDALTRIREALDTFENLPHENADHAAALGTYAALCMRRRNYSDAEHALRQALALTENLSGRNADYESLRSSLGIVRSALKAISKTSGAK